MKFPLIFLSAALLPCGPLFANPEAFGVGPERVADLPKDIKGNIKGGQYKGRHPMKDKTGIGRPPKLRD